MKGLRPIRVSFAMWWRELRYQWLPWLVFAGLLALVAIIWRMAVAKEEILRMDSAGNRLPPGTEMKPPVAGAAATSHPKQKCEGIRLTGMTNLVPPTSE